VVLPDGRPASGVQIFLEDPRWPWQVFTVAANTDGEGQFVVTALDRTRYRVHAVQAGRAPISAEPLLVEPGSSDANIRLVLDRKGHTPSEQAGRGLDGWRQGRGLP
jgi:hypothetical protein